MSSGKGSSRRPTKESKYRQEWDRIFLSYGSKRVQKMRDLGLLDEKAPGERCWGGCKAPEKYFHAGWFCVCGYRLLKKGELNREEVAARNAK